MTHVIIMIEKTANDSWGILITNSVENKLVTCLESTVFKIGDTFVFEPEISDAEREYIKSILIKY